MQNLHWSHWATLCSQSLTSHSVNLQASCFAHNLPCQAVTCHLCSSLHKQLSRTHCCRPSCHMPACDQLSSPSFDTGHCSMASACKQSTCAGQASCRRCRIYLHSASHILARIQIAGHCWTATMFNCMQNGSLTQYLGSLCKQQSSMLLCWMLTHATAQKNYTHSNRVYRPSVTLWVPRVAYLPPCTCSCVKCNRGKLLENLNARNMAASVLCRDTQEFLNVEHARYTHIRILTWRESIPKTTRLGWHVFLRVSVQNNALRGDRKQLHEALFWLPRLGKGIYSSNIPLSYKDNSLFNGDTWHSNRGYLLLGPTSHHNTAFE